jgi:hypothetical protein
MTVIEEMKAFEANTIWIDSHYKELREKYPDEYVAVWKERVVEHGPEIPAIMESLKEKYPSDYSHIPIEFINSEDIELILSC